MRFTVDLQAESKRSPALAQSARQPLVDRLRPNRRPSTECNDGFTESRSLKGHRLRKQRMLRGAGPLPRCDLLSHFLESCHRRVFSPPPCAAYPVPLCIFSFHSAGRMRGKGLAGWRKEAVAEWRQRQLTSTDSICSSGESTRKTHQSAGFIPASRPMSRCRRPVACRPTTRTKAVSSRHVGPPQQSGDVTRLRLSCQSE